jgi:DNA packaging protein, QLRG family
MDNFLTLKEVKDYLRIDFDDDDLWLQSLMVATMDYLRDSIDDFDKKLEKEKFKSRAKILALVLLQDWYDNREHAESKDFTYTVRSMMTQLQVSGNYE